MVKVGIVGGGFMGTTHGQAYKLLPGVELVGLADIDEPKRARFVDSFGGRGFASLEELLEEDLDIVDVCLPTFLHKEAVIKAAQAGKNVLCEKPIALTLEDADEMIEAAERSKVKFMVAHVLRFWPDYQVIKETVDSGKLGAIQLVTASRLSSIPTWSWENWLLQPKLSGGAVVDLHIHDLDFIAWIMGKPKGIFASGLKSESGALNYVLTQGIEHEKGGGVSFAEGALGMPEKFPFTMTMKVVGDKGCLEFDSRDAEKPITIYQFGKEPEYPQIPQPKLPEIIPSAEAIGNIQALGGYFVEIEYFVNCVKEDKMPEVVTPEEAKLALQLCLAAKESAETGKIVTL